MWVALKFQWHLISFIFVFQVLVWHTKAKDPIIKHTSYNDTDPSPVIERKVETKKIEYEEIQTSN